MRIAVDAMGSDNAPMVEVEAAVLASKELNVEVVLVGKEDILKAELSKYSFDSKKITIYNATETISMNESPFESVRRKKDSTINVCAKLVKDKIVDAMVSAGNTGAVVCASSLYMRLLAGVDKPGIMVIYPTMKKGPVVFIDAGANIDPKPKDIFLYGLMGSIYAELILKRDKPTIGLLNIGEESSKGTSFMKETHQYLKSSQLNFIGNVEGKEMFKGAVDVVVTDGFMGNVVLKISESIAFTVYEFLKRELKRSLLTKIGTLLCMPAFKAFKKETDYSEYGGAPLLGVNGVVIICHGRSTPKAIKNAIRAAEHFVENNINEHIIGSMKNIPQNINT